MACLISILKVGFKIMILARGYIASGEFNGNRVPQHLQNQIVKAYCDSNGLEFILSRAEYWINGSTVCQLWAALREGFHNIVFFSLWQLPCDLKERIHVYNYCLKNNIILHFAVERMSTSFDESCFLDLEVLFQSNALISTCVSRNEYLEVLKDLL